MPGVNSLQSSLEGMQFTLNRREFDIQNRASIDDQSFDLSFSGIDRTIRDKSLDFNKLQLDNIRVNQYLQSEDYVTGVSGWRINMAPGLGDVEFGSGTFRGTITATAGTIGGFSIGADYIRDAANSMGLASTVTGGDDVRFWAGDTFANRATAPFRVTESGLLTATGATINGTQLLFEGIYGDGSDGVVTINSNTTLTSDVFWDDGSSITNNAIVTTAGYRIFCNGTLTVDAGCYIQRNGNNGGAGGNGTNASSATPGTGGAAGAAASALADGSLPGAAAGVAGAVGVNGIGDSVAHNGTAGTNGTTGTSQSKCIVTTAGSSGGAGGAGGDANDGSGGSASGGAASSGGTGGTNTSNILNEIRTYVAAYLLYDPQTNDFYNISPVGGSGGSGGVGAVDANGAGRGDSGGSGGGGGSGGSGGCIAVFARILINNGTIRAIGGTGGNGGNAGTSYARNPGSTGGSGGGGTGSGGNGGVVILIYNSYSGSGTLSVAGGSAGQTVGTGAPGVVVGGSTAGNGSNGSIGSNGSSGVLIQLQI